MGRQLHFLCLHATINFLRNDIASLLDICILVSDVYLSQFNIFPVCSDCVSYPCKWKHPTESDVKFLLLEEYLKV